MYLARVLGSVVAPVQHPFFDGRRLLCVRCLDPDGTETGPDHIAVDRVQAGPGDVVLVLKEGSSARDLYGDAGAPVRSVIVGHVDEVEVGGRRVL